MATIEVEINNTTFTQVLDGEGFAICDSEALYAFGDTSPTVAGFRVNPANQVNGKDGHILWSKCKDTSPAQDYHTTAIVSVTAG